MNRAVRYVPGFAGVWLMLVAAVGCGRGKDPGIERQLGQPKNGPASAAAETLEGSPGPATSSAAAAIVAALRERLEDVDLRESTSSADAKDPPLTLMATFRTVEGGLRPHFGSKAPTSVRALLPVRSTGAIHLADATTGLAVDVTLDGAKDVPAEAANGYLVYRGAYGSGATWLHRALPVGLEDFVSFEARPRVTSVSYRLSLGEGVKGLRLVANTLELVDAGGAPRLRVTAPYVVGADGARTLATLAVEGCAVDRSPAGPWGRAVTAPGHESCRLRVSWSAKGVAYPAVLDPRWTSTTNTMVAHRQLHTATLLSNGKVLVAGGNDGTAAVATAELFDRTTNTWTPTGSMTGIRQAHSAVLLPTSGNATTSGKVLVAGGFDGSISLDTAQLYDTTAGTWTAAANLNTRRHMHTATWMPNVSRVLIAGGMNGSAVLNTAALYNPATGTGSWAATSNTMPSAARAHTATFVVAPAHANFLNKVLVIGGNSGGTTSVANVQVFNGTTWSSSVALPGVREGHTATLLANGKVLVTGGKAVATVIGSTFTFDTTLATPTWVSAGTLQGVRQAHTATLLTPSILSNGQVLVVGGATASGPLGTAELWNGTTTWTLTSALTGLRQGHTATMLTNNAVLVAGGLSGTMPPLNTAQIYDPSFGLSCTTNAQCSSGFCVDGVCCDTACNGGCGACNVAGSVGTCTAKTNAMVCRAPTTGGCDVAETCNGSALTCPTDGFAAAGVSCRIAAGECDLAEVCAGGTPNCPTDAKKAANTVCTDDGNVCTTDKCDGTAVTCQRAAGNAGTVCRAAVAGGCDVAETCTGTSTACPTDGFAAAGVSCRIAAGECDLAEVCAGGTPNCPVDAKKSLNTPCTDDGNVCTTDMCNGTAVTCQRAAGNAGTVCRAAAAGGCDVAETCTGSSTACPTDGFAAAGTLCRIAAGECDLAETCAGGTPNCPTDAKKAANTVCTDDGNVCTTDKCNGTAVTCQRAAGNAGTVCRAAVAGGCDVAETCTGTSMACPTDVFASAATVCRTAASQCDVAESCSGNNAACPGDVSRADGTACDDGNPASQNDVCYLGACAGGVQGQYVPLTIIQPLNPGDDVTRATGINQAGTMIGWSGTAVFEQYGGGTAKGFVRREVGPAISLALPAADVQVFPKQINAQEYVPSDAYPGGLQGESALYTALDQPPGVTPWPRFGDKSITDIDSTGSYLLATQTYGMGGALAAWKFENDVNDVVTKEDGHTSLNNFSAAASRFEDGPLGNRALTFNGTDADCLTRASSADNEVFGASLGKGFTIMAWVNPKLSSGPNHCPSTPVPLFRRGDQFGLGLTCGAPGKDIVHGSVAASPDDAGPSIDENTWVHVAVTYDLHKLRYFVNGTLVTSHAAEGAMASSAANIFVGGCYQPNIAFFGSLDEMSVFRQALTQDQIRLYKNGAVPYPWLFANNEWGQIAHDGVSGETQQSFIIPMTGPGYTGVAYPAAMNAQGDMVGFENVTGGTVAAFSSAETGMIDLNSLLSPVSDWTLLYANGINNARQVVGAGVRNGRWSAFRMDIHIGDIVTADIVDLVEPGAPWATPGGWMEGVAINSAGHVVGTVYPPGSFFYSARAFIYTDTAGSVDLNDFVDPASGSVIRQAAGINDADEVVGYANVGGTSTIRAYRMKVPTPSDECAGKSEGSPCERGTFCPANNVCHNGVCGGGDPADAVCLSVTGVVDVGGDRVAAIFGYDNESDATIVPTLNQVSIDGAAVPFPDPSPPAWLAPGHPVDAYISRFRKGSGHFISWQVNGQKVTANGLPNLQKLDNVPGIAVAVPGKTVTVSPDIAGYSAPPDQIEPTGPPTVGSRFYGTLEGKLSVGPTGAATYTLPISIPPGIAGMAPSLSLVYNSQTGDGIAGQGWSLSGLSMIHQCPKTRIQDGIAQPVSFDVASAGNGVCIDGKRLFEDEQHPGTYSLEVTDFSTIKKIGNTFVVTAKTGETRYYGLSSNARVVPFPYSANDLLGKPTVIWALERVVDQWGNYFDVVYNDNTQDFESRGLIPTAIKYTGHLPTQAPTFATISFQYESGVRKDQRMMRFGTGTVPIKKLLSGITTDLGVYTLTYLTKDLQGAKDWLMLPSQLDTIKYCATPKPVGSECPELKFDWTGGGFTSMETSTDAFTPPAPIDPYFTDGTKRSRGTQFVDLDADGLPDVVQARYISGSVWHNHWNVPFLQTDAWRNTGSGFVSKPDWALPNNLVDGDGNPGGSVLVDMDGDGKLDFVTHYFPANFPDLPADKLCDPPTGGGATQCIDNPSMVVYLNRITPTCQALECWKIDLDLSTVNPNGSPDPWPGMHFLPHTGPWQDSLVDMNGDGRADLFRTTYSRIVLNSDGGTVPTAIPGEYSVLINDKTGWHETNQYSLINAVHRPSNVEDYHLADVNRDGLPDLVNREAGNNARYIGVNTGIMTGNVWDFHDSPEDPHSNVSAEMRLTGDISADGYYDPVTFFTVVPKFGETFPFLLTGGTVTAKPTLSLGMGIGYTSLGADGFTGAIATFGPDQQVAQFDVSQLPNYASGMADLNADGLADLVLNHDNGGQPLINTGVTWEDLNGATDRQQHAGVLKTKFVPNEVFFWDAFIAPAGTAFVDINGDGVTDLVRAAAGVTGGAYLNTYVPPTVTGFPAGLATKTTVNYSVITTNAAQTGLDPVYSDPESTIRDGTTALALPMRVVESVEAEDGRAIGSLAKTKYQYQSLRGSAFGRGPQGFRKVIVTEPSDSPQLDGTGTAGTRTETTYSQIFPYTGLPISVVKKKDNVVLSATTTTYCDRISTTGEPACADADGAGGQYPVHSRLQVYPRRVLDIAYPIYSPFAEQIETASTFTYDTFGNIRSLVVETKKRMKADAFSDPEVTESYQSTTNTLYGQSDTAPEAEQGKPTLVVTTNQRTDGSHPATVHTTGFDYADEGGFQVSIADGTSNPPTNDSHVRRALKKKLVEPNAWKAEQPDPLQDEIEVHTAYGYDAFGNVKLTTSCASDFSQCEAGASNSSTGDPRYHPPFRTTEVSYDPQYFNYPAGAGDDLQHVPGNIQNGRFPVRTTNPEGHTEYTLYNAVTGLLRQRTGPNGIHTCFRYDEYGHQTAEIARCGTDAPLETSVQQFLSLGIAGDNLPIVTVTHAPGTPGSWTYSDSLGRSAVTLAFGFDGMKIENGRTTWNVLGQVSTTSKPRAFPDGAVYLTTHTYDRLGPEKKTVQDLGATGATGETGQSDLTRTFYGMTVITNDLVTAEDPISHARTTVSRSRSEAKNAMGKVEAVTDAYGKTITYAYDADGNLTDTTDAAGNMVHLEYNGVGRKLSTTDPDLGAWAYRYNGYGDLLEQRDASQTITTAMTYDRLGRMTRKTANGVASEWVFDVADHGVGKLAAVVGPPDVKLSGSCAIENASLTDGNRSGKWFHYNLNGDVQEAFECIDATTFSTQFGYDPATGRQASVVYPEVAGNRLGVYYNYTHTGFLQYVADADGSVFWTATGRNAAGQVTTEKTRNGVDTTSERSPATGWLLQTTSTAHGENDNLIQGWDNEFDEAGNLRARTRAQSVNTAPWTESFGYDRLDRLTSAHTTVQDQAGYDAAEPFEYDAQGLGNLTKKGGKTYTYGGCSGGPHAVCSVDGASFQYDENGNMTSGGGRTVEYGAIHKPTRIVDSQSSAEAHFVYGADGDRVVQEIVSQTGAGVSSTKTVYVGMGGTGKSLYERATTGDVVENTQFIYAGDAHGGSAFAVRVIKTSLSTTSVSDAKMSYYHTDHLGSVTAVSDDTGHVEDAGLGAAADAPVMGYDAWGGRRNPNGRPADPASFNHQPGHREFTGHEAIPAVGLVNMNGRVYDPVLGRFLSPDPTVQFVANLQSYNRYSYVLNNPLRYTDPTGFQAIFSDSIDGYITGALMVGGMVACAAGGPGLTAACITGMVINTAWTATTMAASGASTDQIVFSTGVGLFAGFATGGIVKGINGGPLAQMIGGAASGAIVGAFSTAVMGGNLGENMIMGAVHGYIGAVMAMAVGGIVSAADEIAAQGEQEPEVFESDEDRGRLVAGKGKALSAKDVRARIAEIARDHLGETEGWGNDDTYSYKGVKIRPGEFSYKCNCMVFQVIDEAGAIAPVTEDGLPKTTNQWARAKSLPGWARVSVPENGDIAAFPKREGIDTYSGHLGVVNKNGPNGEMFIAVHNGRVEWTSAFLNPGGGVKTVYWRWVGGI